MPKKKVIGFDLDGTLIDSIGLYLDSFVHAADGMGLRITRNQVAELFSHPSDVIVRILVPGLNKRFVDTLVALEHKHFMENIHKVKPFPYVTSTLTKLKKTFKTALISNTQYDNILRSLAAAKLNPCFFDIIVGSDLVTHPKPHGDELFLVEKILRHQIDFYVGDSPADMKAGMNVGIKTIGIATGVTKKEELCEYKPFAVLKSIRSLPKVIE